MLAKLISLLIHAKSGAISGVLLLGATGALVSVSATNGVTTITITEASPSPSASAGPSTSPNTGAAHTASPSPSPSAASPQLSSPSTSTACTDEAKALALQVQRVNSAFTGFRTDLVKLRGQRAGVTLERADVLLKVVREAAVRAIHATATKTCLKHDDEDEKDTDSDEDADNDDDTSATTPTVSTLSLVGERDNDEENDGDHAKPSTTAPVTFSGTAASIADQAVAAMQAAFDTAKNAPVTTPKPTPTHKVEAPKLPVVDPTRHVEQKDPKGDHD